MLKRSALIFQTFSIVGWFTGAAKLSHAKDPELSISTSVTEEEGYFTVQFRHRT